MLTLKNLSKKFDEKIVLKNINEEFKPGLNFIIGPSGSGKTTLLKILSGIDRNYEGKVFTGSKDLKLLSEDELNEYYYNSVGFIWQDFKLIDHLTVEENVSLPLDLLGVPEEFKKKKIGLLLKQLNLEGLGKKSVSKLSGGQKQRVSIARAIVKNPDIIIADEPTGALDKKTSEKIMSVLRVLAKEKVVIVVTHDKSVVDENSNCFELRNGALNQISIGRKVNGKSQSKKCIKPKLSFKDGIKRALNNIKGLSIRLVATSLILAISSYLVLLNVNSTLTSDNNEIFNKLIAERGEKIKDISIPTSAISGSGMGGDDGTSLNIQQDVSSVLDKYKDDERVEDIRINGVVSNMEVTIDGLIKDYKVEQSNNVPILNNIVAGRLPNLNEREVAVTEEFVNRSGLNIDDVLGKKISIKGTFFDWSTGSPIEKKTSIDDVTIVGVTNSSDTITLQNGEKFEMVLEDSFFYSLEVLNELKGLSKDNKNMSFTIRVKDINDVLPIVDELKKMGITPLGEFEEVGDILSMNNVTESQSGALTVIIGALGILVMLVTSIINAYLRKSEFGILRINGYSKISIFKLSNIEYLLLSVISSAVLLVLFPIINSFSPSMSMDISLNNILVGVLITIIQALVMGTLSSLIYGNINIEKTLIGNRR